MAKCISLRFRTSLDHSASVSAVRYCELLNTKWAGQFMTFRSVIIIDRTAFRYGNQGSTRRLHQLATAWTQLGLSVSLVRSNLKFMSPDGPAARAVFPGTVIDVEPNAPLQFLHSSRLARPLLDRAKRYLDLPQYHWGPSLLDRGARAELQAAPSKIWAVCKGSIENLNFAQALSQATGHPWVLSLHDPPTGLIKDGRIEESVLERVAPLFESANHICTTSATLRDILIDGLAVLHDKITNVPLRHEPATQLRRPRQGIWHTEGERQELSLVYAGQLHGDANPGQRSLRPLIDAIQILRAVRPDARLFVVSMGMGAGHEQAQRYASELGLENTFIALGSQEQDSVRNFEANAGAVIVVQGEAQRHQMPSKVFEVLESDRPILALVPIGSEVERVLRSSGQALIAGPNDVSTIVQHLATLVDGRFAPAEPESGHEALMNDYQLESLPSQLLEILNLARERP